MHVGSIVQRENHASGGGTVVVAFQKATEAVIAERGEKPLDQRPRQLPEGIKAQGYVFD